MRRRIPYIVVGGMKFYERAEVKDALAYLRLAGRPEDDLAFRRVVNVPSRGIGQATLDRIAKAARDAGKSWWEISANPPAELTDRARTALSRFRAIVSELAERAQSEPPSALLEHLLEATGYAALYDRSEDSEDVARRENLAELVSSAREFERRSGEDATLAEYRTVIEQEGADRAVLLALFVLLVAMLAAASLRILREYQRGVVFQLGRFRFQDFFLPQPEILRNFEIQARRIPISSSESGPVGGICKPPSPFTDTTGTSGRATLAPSAASWTAMGTITCRSSPSR